MIDMAMKERASYILSLNCGSSSIKFSVCMLSDPSQYILKGKIQSIGKATTTLSVSNGQSENIAAENITQAGEFLIGWLEKQTDFGQIQAVGHRIVHGMDHTHAELITKSTLMALKKNIILDPDHLPAALALIEIISSKYPSLKQIACYDTAFHRDLPTVSRTFALPRKLEKQGIKRYGFHGLSYSYLLEKLKKDVSARQAKGRLILIHLGSGASMAAVSNLKSIDTTMGLTPTGGLMMGTRSGDLDPGIILYLLQKDALSIPKLNKLLNKESGLLGVSGQTADMQKLLKLEKTDVNAAEAIALFCYQVKKNLCAYIGILGGVDTIVFTGGIGENIAEIRSRICSGLEFLGIELNQKKNNINSFKISASKRTAVYVIKTDEEYMIALLSAQLIKSQISIETKA